MKEEIASTETVAFSAMEMIINEAREMMGPRLRPVHRRGFVIVGSRITVPVGMSTILEGGTGKDDEDWECERDPQSDAKDIPMC